VLVELVFLHRTARSFEGGAKKEYIEHQETSVSTSRRQQEVGQRVIEGFLLVVFSLPLAASSSCGIAVLYNLVLVVLV
jgi:hypothetical protein